jgi:hypothetical protein
LSESAGLERAFPNLKPGKYSVTSPADGRYNCIAFAAGDSTRFWWPSQALPAGFHWPLPPGPGRDCELSNFEKAFATLGYERCDSADLESGFEKVAIYIDANGVPTHAARQLPSGEWTSKLGSYVDITHTAPEDVGGHAAKGYGDVALVMRRQL